MTLRRVPLKRKTPLRAGRVWASTPKLDGPRARRRKVSDPTPTVRAEVLHRTGGLCALWREGRRCPYPATELHHRKPRSAGGSHEVENLLPLCAPHHGEVHGNPESSYADGLLLHSWQPVSPWPDRWFR